MNERITHTTIELARLLERFTEENRDTLQALVARLVGTFTGDGRLLIAAGGNLRPVAQMIANHFTHRLGFDRPSLPAISLGSDAALANSLTRSNQQHLLLARHYRALGSNNHLLLILSDGAADPQLSELVKVAGDDQPLALFSPKKNTDSNLLSSTEQQILVDTETPARLVELSIFCGNLLCELVEAELFGV